MNTYNKIIFVCMGNTCRSPMAATIMQNRLSKYDVLPSVGEYWTSSRISRILSTPLFDAASISMTFMERPSAIALQVGHSPHGLPSTGCSQLTAFAKIFATVVLPVPRVPQKRYACPILSARI